MHPTKAINELLKEQRENCRDEYSDFFAESSEDFSNPTYAKAILNAPSPKLPPDDDDSMDAEEIKNQILFQKLLHLTMEN